MSLLEVTIVLLVLIGLAGLVVPFMTNASARANCMATDSSLVNIRNAITGDFKHPGYQADMSRLPVTLDELYFQDGQADFDPVSKTGWRGPYLISRQTEDGFLTGNPIILDIPTNLAEEGGVDDNNNCTDLGLNDDELCIRLISNGPDGVLDTLPADADASSRNDDRILYLSIPDPNANLIINCTTL